MLELVETREFIGLNFWNKLRDARPDALEETPEVILCLNRVFQSHVCGLFQY